MSISMLFNVQEIQEIKAVREIDAKHADMRRLSYLLKNETFVSITWVNTNNSFFTEHAGGDVNFNACSFEANINIDGFIRQIQVSDRFGDIKTFYETIRTAFDISANNNRGLSSAFRKGKFNLEKWCESNIDKDVTDLSLFYFDYRAIACIPYKA